MAKPPTAQNLFNAARITQTAANTFKECTYRHCGRKKRCLGGPRGTCRATGGFPICTREGQRRKDMYEKRRVWQAETGHEDEGPVECSTRHLEHMIKRIEIDKLVKEAHAALNESDALLRQLG